MSLLRLLISISLYASIFLVSFACNNKAGDGKNTIANTPEELQEKTVSVIKEIIEKSVTDTTSSLDSVTLIHQPEIIKEFYSLYSFAPVWSKKGEWLQVGDSLAAFVYNSRLFGLFPEDYHSAALSDIQKEFIADSLNKGVRKDAAYWAKADIMLTDAFLQITKHIKLGRLPKDSVSQRVDSVISAGFLQKQFELVEKTGSVKKAMESLEPRHKAYIMLKQGIPGFLSAFDSAQYTFVPSKKDSVRFVRALQKRLFEGGCISFKNTPADSIQLANAIKQYQKQKGLKVDGKPGEATIRLLNNSDKEKFIRIAISLDKYKHLPDEMPVRFIWVNTASNYMDVYERGDIKFTSKVICGKPITRTPLLNSKISEIITYPQWVPPSSIIVKEILPAIKRNPGYLARRGFRLIDSKGEAVDPYSIDWSKYNKSIPYRVVQGSGDANALGIIKFVFSNKYAVYLHDTNQRYLFANSYRSLSHGCVRVQDWSKLAQYILRSDSLVSSGKDFTRTDSLNKWLGEKKKMTIQVRNKLQVFIRYITCEGKNGKILFYDDLYNEDKMIREKYFSGK